MGVITFSSRWHWRTREKVPGSPGRPPVLKDGFEQHTGDYPGREGSTYLPGPEGVLQDCQNRGAADLYLQNRRKNTSCRSINSALRGAFSFFVVKYEHAFLFVGVTRCTRTTTRRSSTRYAWPTGARPTCAGVLPEASGSGSTAG